MENNKELKKPFIGDIEEYPEELRFNTWILSGYRCCFYTYESIFRSLFMWHNETINVWSHLLGKLFYIYVIIWLYSTYPKMSFAAEQYEQSNPDLIEDLNLILTNSTPSHKFTTTLAMTHIEGVANLLV